MLLGVTIRRLRFAALGHCLAARRSAALAHGAASSRCPVVLSPSLSFVSAHWLLNPSILAITSCRHFMLSATPVAAGVTAGRQVDAGDFGFPPANG
eukprot:682692-Rhodomonas_salina.3